MLSKIRILGNNIHPWPINVQTDQCFPPNLGGCERHGILQLCGRQHPGGEREQRLPPDQQDQLPHSLALAGTAPPLLPVTDLPAYQHSQHTTIMTHTLRAEAPPPHQYMISFKCKI